MHEAAGAAVLQARLLLLLPFSSNENMRHAASNLSSDVTHT